MLETIKGNLNWNSILQYEIIDIEKRFAVNKDLISILYDTEDNDPFFSSGIDLNYIDGDTAYVVDWKSVRAIYTKKYMEESLQKKIYSWQVFKHYPQVQVVQFACYTSNPLPDLDLRIDLRLRLRECAETLRYERISP